jgi:hypothetical protein
VTGESRSVVVVAGRVGSHRASRGWVVCRLIRALVERGRRVELVCESIDDPCLLPRAASVVAMNRFEQSASDYPSGFPRWAARNANAAARRLDQRLPRSLATVLSLSRRVGGDVWMPMDPSASSWLSELAGRRGLVRSGPTLLKHAGVMATRAVETLRPAPIEGRAPRRVLVIGSEAGEAARRVLPPSMRERVRVLEPWSDVDASATSSDHQDLRRRVRACLGIDEAQVLMLVGMTAGGIGASGTARTTDGLDALFAATRDHLAHARPSGSGNPLVDGPALVVLAREQFPVHDAAARHGLDAGGAACVNVVGLSSCVDELLIASDMLVLPTPALPLGRGGAFASGASGRLAADALALGKPIVAVDGAPGVELIRRRDLDNAEPGLVVRMREVGGPDTGSVHGGWRRALRSIMDPAWRSRATRAATRASGTVGWPALVDRVIDEL